MLERHKLLMGRTQDRAGQNNGSIGVFWRSFNGIIGHIRYMFRGLKITYPRAKDLKTIETYWGIKLLPATISVISPMGHHGPVVQVTREKIQIWSTMEGYYPLFGQ